MQRHTSVIPLILNANKMKKIAKYIAVLGLFIGGSNLQAQVTSIPVDNIQPDDSVKIIVDLAQLDQSVDHNQLLVAAATAGDDMYIWTWKPAEHPAGHPLVNGTGGAPWKSSNEALKMTHEGGLVYSYTMVPTEWYEVDVATVYKEDIWFLVKPKDGGGYGDPDIKSDDLILAIDPAYVVRDPVWAFPAIITENDVVTIIYENDRETKPAMVSAAETNFYVYLEFWTVNDDLALSGKTVSPWALVGSNANLNMTHMGDRLFELSFVPKDLFGQTDEIAQFRAVVKLGDNSTASGRSDVELIVDLTACP